VTARDPSEGRTSGSPRALPEPSPRTAAGGGDAQARPEKDEELVHAQSGRADGDEAEQHEASVLERRASETPERLQDDGDDDGLHSVQKSFGPAHPPEADVSPGQGPHDRDRGKDEREPGHEEARESGSTVSDVDRHLG